jgi:general secretion pathway protein B
MSFILDALKKSELERQRQTTPGLIDVGSAAPRSGLPLWAWLIGALLAVNLVVLGFVLLRRGGTAAPPVASSVRSPAPGTVPGGIAGAAQESSVDHAVAASASAVDHFSPMDGAPTYAPEVPVVESAGPGADTTTARSAARRPPPATRAPETKVAEDTEEVLPTLSELSSSTTEGLPELHLDVHVFATVPADRFVFINGRKYHEGMKLQEGPLLERIRRDGIVLNYQGVRFLLPRE